MSDAVYKFGNVGEIVDSISLLVNGREEDAERFLEQYVDYMHTCNTEGWDRGRSRDVCLINIGYCAGYLNMEAIRKVDKLLGAKHPVF